METEYLYSLVEVKTERSKDKSGSNEIETKNRLQASGTQSYVIDEYAGILRTTKNVVQEAASHHTKLVAKYYRHTEGRWQGYAQGNFRR